MEREFVLAIETASGAGSLSLFRNDVEVDSVSNLGVLARSEELITTINKLLNKNNASKSDLKRIIYSSGPGSQTGIRIGSATALGLAYALSCGCREMSLFEALAFETKAQRDHLICIQASEKEFWIQFFNQKENNPKVPGTGIERVSRKHLFEIIINSIDIKTTIIAKESPAEIIPLNSSNIKMYDPNYNFASFLNITASV